MTSSSDRPVSRSPIVRFIYRTVRNRKIRRSAVIVSAVISLACLAEWDRTFDKSDSIAYKRSERTGVTNVRETGVDVTFGGCGTISAGWFRQDENGMSSHPPPDGGTFTTNFGRADARIWHTDNYTAIPLGQFGVVSSTRQILTYGPRTDRRVSVPFWCVAAIFAVWPAVTVRQWIRRRGRHDPSHYRRCGYDLRATPGRCPECGAVGTGPGPVA